MKLSIRFSILVVLMLLVAFVMYQFATKVAVPYLLASNDELIITFGLILGTMSVLTIWVGVGEFLMKVLKCEEIIYKFIGGTEK